MSYSFIEQVAKLIAEIQAEKADPADYLPNNTSDVADDAESEFAPWNDDSASDELHVLL